MGTHIDTPAHSVQGMWSVDQIPIEKLYGQGVIINVKSTLIRITGNLFKNISENIHKTLFA